MIAFTPRHPTEPRFASESRFGPASRSQLAAAVDELRDVLQSVVGALGVRPAAPPDYHTSVWLEHLRAQVVRADSSLSTAVRTLNDLDRTARMTPVQHEALLRVAHREPRLPLDRLVEVYATDNVSCRGIAKQYGKRPEDISILLRATGVKIRRGGAASLRPSGSGKRDESPAQPQAEPTPRTPSEHLHH